MSLECATVNCISPNRNTRAFVVKIELDVEIPDAGDTVDCTCPFASKYETPLVFVPEKIRDATVDTPVTINVSVSIVPITLTPNSQFLFNIIKV